ncbi:hypothetical protein ACFXI8_26910 [Streptomyces niveus]|uniref:hypothetical protein n=1 Tax=Streptomyces niveus TaxID=193462 RepID=UPI0036A5D2D1
MAKFTNDRRAQQDAREAVDALRALGVETSISQVLKEETAVSAWRGGHTATLVLARKMGWDASGVRPEYRDHPDHGLMVLMTRDAFETASTAASERTRANEPILLAYLVNKKSGGTKLRHLPVVDVRLRSGQMRPQVLTDTAWPLTVAPDVVWAEIPANRPHHPQRGIPCVLCDVYGATRLRRDKFDRPALICDDCVQKTDTNARAWPSTT